MGNFWDAVTAYPTAVFTVLLLRLAHKRLLGKWSALDFVLTIIVGSNLSRALTADAPFVEGRYTTSYLPEREAFLPSLRPARVA